MLIAGRRNVFESLKIIYRCIGELDSVGGEETTERLKLSTLLLQGGLI